MVMSDGIFHGGFVKEINFEGEREFTKKECLNKGMSEKEYDIQQALGSLPVTNGTIYTWQSRDDDGNLCTFKTIMELDTEEMIMIEENE